MTVRIGINGFGRIGCLVFRCIVDLGEKSSDIEIVTINDLTTPTLLAYLLKYDSAHGTFSHEVSAADDSVVVDGKRYRVYAEPQAWNIPWAKNDDVDFVLECTGFYTNEVRLEIHLKAGAKRVLTSTPAGPDLKTIVHGVNGDTLTADDKIVSAGSCTTNSLALMVNASQKEFGIEVNTMTTTHAYISTQMLLDGSIHGGNLRSARAATINIIPHSTGATKVISLVIPELNGKLNGHTQHVSVPDGSITELASVLSKDVTAGEANEAVKKYESPSFACNGYSVVSSGVLGMTAGPIFGPTQTMVTTVDDKQLVKIVAWHGSEYSFICQIVRTLLKFATL